MNTLSTKDIVYLKDMFNWNLIAIKKYNVYSEYIDKDLVKNLVKMHEDNNKKILNILGSGINE